MDEFDDRPDFAKRLEQARIKRFNGEKNATEACEYFGWNYDTYIQHERGLRGIGRAADKYARGYRVSEGWLLIGEGGMERRNKVALMGYIGAGAAIDPDFEQVPPEGLAEIDLPFDVPAEMVAFEIRGGSMMPRYDDGDVVICYAEQRTDFKAFYGEEAAVRTVGGLRYLKRIEPGTRPRTVNLVSVNANATPIKSVKLEWIGEIYATVRSGQIRRMQQRERKSRARAVPAA